MACWGLLPLAFTGSQLSGGIDSSIVSLLAAEVSGDRMGTFSVIREDEKHSEEPWSDRAAQITPPTSMHSHHNRGTERMRCLIFQDEALHYYTRTPGFSFDSSPSVRSTRAPARTCSSSCSSSGSSTR